MSFKIVYILYYKMTTHIAGIFDFDLPMGF